MIPDDLVERIREQADIVGIIGEHVTLKRAGADFRGPCPFHQGTHRNFSVSPRRHIYYCFVCHEGGDVFNFLMKRLGMDWPTAVREVAARSGIEVPEDRRRGESDPRERDWELNGVASEYFRRMLWDDDSGRDARKYLEERGITREMADRVSLGWAPREIGLLRGHLNTLGYDDERLLEIGMLVLRDETAEPRPRFRARLMFPIYDVVNRTVGFGGRLIAPGEPKYLNSAESPVFSKGKLLYALNWSKGAVRRDERVLIVEGYIDVLRLMAAGVESVAAPLGTALTENQASLVTRYTKNVFLLYDSDTAGLKATFRSGDELLRQGAAVRVVTLPSGEDPDSFVRSRGAHGLEALIADALDIFERKIQELERKAMFRDLHRRRKAVDYLLPTIRATADPVTRELYISRAAEVAGVSADMLRREVGEGGVSRSRSPERPESREREREREPMPPPEDRAPAPAPAPREPEAVRGGGAGAERMLIGALVHSPARIAEVAPRVTEQDFVVPVHRQMFVALRGLGAAATPERLAESLSPDGVALLNVICAQPDAFADPDAQIAGSLNRMRVRRLQARMSRIDRDFAIAQPSEQNALLQEKAALVEEMRTLGGRWKLFSRARRSLNTER